MSNLTAYLLAFSLSASMNFLFSKFWRFKFLQSGKQKNRWKKKVVPLTGGLSICFTLMIILATQSKSFSITPKTGFLFLGGFLLFVLGLIDDLINLKSHQKLFIQILIIFIVIKFGFDVSFFNSPIQYFISFIWIITITNSFNLLDNIDGLAVGVAIIIMLYLGINCGIIGKTVLGNFCFLLLFIFLGFIIFNFNPAKVFLGDSGALLIGYTLSILTIIISQQSSQSLLITLLLPVMVMAIPIFDTVFVSITRKLRGQSPFTGGQDHLSHRLVMLGMSERKAVVLLYAISGIMGASTFLTFSFSPCFRLIFYFFISLSLIMFGFYIGKIKIGFNSKCKKNSFYLKNNFLYNNKILLMLSDLILLGLIYYFSYFIRFESKIQKGDLKLFWETLPLIIIFKIIFLYCFKVYRIKTTHFSLTQGMQILKSITLGSMSTVLCLTFFSRFNGYSRGIFLIDWMFSVFILVSIKISFRVFDEFFSPIYTEQNAKMIYIGNQGIYEVLKRYLNLKPNTKLSFVKCFDEEEFKIESFLKFLKKTRNTVSIIVSERTEIFNKYEEKLKGQNVRILSEKEFFIEMFKKE